MLNKVHAKTLWLQIKKTYAIKSIILIIALPFDIILLLYLIINKKKYDCLFLTLKWPELITKKSLKANVAVVAAPTAILFCHRNKIEYIPASLFYILASFGLWIPKKMREEWSFLAVKSITIMIRNFFKDTASLVVHSDALPFGRALVIAAKNLGVTTICIQHGNFREYNIVTEQDGFLCDVNITRSNEDSKIIKKSNPNTILKPIPDFFLLSTGESYRGAVPRVLLLGEGFHILDANFNNLYIRQLQSLALKIKKIGLEVVFRPHPSERNKYWKNKFENIDNDDLVTSLAKTSSVIGFSSTLLQEAAEIKIPTFYIDPLLNGHRIYGRNNAIISKLKSMDQIYSEAYLRFNTVKINYNEKNRQNAIKVVMNIICNNY
jgi:hypothetical protein